MFDTFRAVAVVICLFFAAGGIGGGEPPGFSHDDWTAVLQRFVDDRGRVDYVGLSADRATFDRYVRSVETVSPKTDPQLFPTRNDALAYYINAYNALVFKGVLARGPEDRSVWRGLISGYTFFESMKVTVGGERMSLKSLEDRLVREQFADPRVHAALNCASLGCPRLPRVAFEPDNLGDALDAAMRGFVGDAGNCRVDAAKRTVTLSKIFDWFASDFTRDSGKTTSQALIDYVNRYRAPGSQIPLDYDVEFFSYDKRINKQ